MAKKRTRQPRAKQAYLDGMDPPSIPEIDTAADRYCACRDARMECLEDELKAKGELMALMQQHSLTVYEYDGKEVVRESLEGIKVRKKKEPSSNGEE